MAKFTVTHNITLNKEKLKPRKGEEVDLTIKRVDEIHSQLEKDERWKDILPVFVRVED